MLAAWRHVAMETHFSYAPYETRRQSLLETPLCPPGTQHSMEPEVHYRVKFEVFTAVTMKNVDFWDIKTQLVLHRRHITSPLQSSAG
jgi:hypothetical protein